MVPAIAHVVTTDPDASDGSENSSNGSHFIASGICMQLTDLQVKASLGFYHPLATWALRMLQAKLTHNVMQGDHLGASEGVPQNSFPSLEAGVTPPSPIWRTRKYKKGMFHCFILNLNIIKHRKQ